jgi:hypothetical protein
MSTTPHCSVNGYVRAAYGRGICKTHHSRSYRTADPTNVRKPGKPRQPLVERPLMTCEAGAGEIVARARREAGGEIMEAICETIWLGFKTEDT